MDDSVRIFKNELGNSITSQVTDHVINGTDGVLISIEGPSSRTDVHVTRLEAKTLLEQLRAFFDK